MAGGAVHATGGSNALLELQAIDGARGGRRLFAGLDLALRGGELLHVRGANGAGKTTLLRLLCGLLPAAAGEVRWRGRPLAAQRDDFHRELLYLGHAAALKDDLSATENLLAACALAGTPASTADAAAALRAAGLRGRERLPARLLSQGQRKRVSLARLALAQDRPLWVLDEPFNALDADAIGWLVGLVEAQLARGGVVVLTSHQPLVLSDGVRQRVLTL